MFKSRRAKYSKPLVILELFENKPGVQGLDTNQKPLLFLCRGAVPLLLPVPLPPSVSVARMRLIGWVCLATAAAGYDINDADADHTDHAISRDEAGDMEGAVASFRAAVKFQPALPEVWNNLAAVLGEVEGEDSEEAQQCQAKAEELDTGPVFPDHLRSVQGVPEDYDFSEDYRYEHTKVGIALSNSGQTTYGAEAFRAALRYNPNQAMMWSNMGMVYRSSAHQEEAAHFYEGAVEVEPKNREAGQWRAEARDIREKLADPNNNYYIKDPLPPAEKFLTTELAARSQRQPCPGLQSEPACPSDAMGDGTAADESAAGIPRIIHQTWKTREVPARFKQYAESWQQSHPEFEYRLWSDEDNRALVRDHYPWFLSTYDGYRETIQRVDSARVLILHRFGGLYVDLDFESLKPMDGLIDEMNAAHLAAGGGASKGHGLAFIGLEPHQHSFTQGTSPIVCNAMMASTKGAPLWRHVIRQYMWNAENMPKTAHTLELTGPAAVTEVLLTGGSVAGVTVFGSSFFYPLLASDNFYVRTMPLDQFLEIQVLRLGVRARLRARVKVRAAGCEG